MPIARARQEVELANMDIASDFLMDIVKHADSYMSSMPSPMASKLPYMSDLGDRIRESREKAPMTQQRLAKLVGVSRASVSQWESGATKSLKPENLLRVAEVLCPPGSTPQDYLWWLVRGTRLASVGHHESPAPLNGRRITRRRATDLPPSTQSFIESLPASAARLMILIDPSAA
ncbi:MAG: helix-turn-helix domain-containing protein [bacterium]